MTEDYVSFETAKLLKKKGFDEQCYAYYNIFYDNDGKSLKLWRKYPHRAQPNSDYLNVPTLQMTMKWLREVHKLFIQICIIPHTTVTIEQKYYLFTIHKDRRMLVFRKDFPSEYYFTYEEACEEAIKYCLKFLI